MFAYLAAQLPLHLHASSSNDVPGKCIRGHYYHVPSASHEIALSLAQHGKSLVARICRFWQPHRSITERTYA